MLEFRRYLEAKRTVDDRALNRRVMDRLRDEVEPAPVVVDVGAGTGIGFERLMDWGLLTRCRYTAIEQSDTLLDDARARLSDRVEGEFTACTLADFSADDSHRQLFDLVIAHAFLDLVELDAGVASLVALARPGGLLYFPITFDGETIFEPAHQSDETILARYHDTIRGDSRTGRRLYHALARAPVDILEMGSSDWIVYPGAGNYPADEAFFLGCIIGMIERSVGEAATDWASTRYQQIDDGHLVYIAHQVDCLAKKRR